MRLFLDEREGAGAIPCPDCGKPLLLAAERRGRWVVGFQYLHLRPGRQAMLVCSDIGCDYREEVQIVDTPDDAVIFSSSNAASFWSWTERSHKLTIGDLHTKLDQLVTLYERTENPKIPSAIRFWRDRYRFTYGSIKHHIKRCMEDGTEVYLTGKGLIETGTVKALLETAVELEKSDGGGTTLIRLADLHNAACYSRRLFSERVRFDFGDQSDITLGNHTIHTPDRFAIVYGLKVAIDSVTSHGLCRVRTDDPQVAKALLLHPTFEHFYTGEVPAAFVERCYKLVRHAYVQGYRLSFISLTRDPNVVQLRTRDMEAARALKMRQERMFWMGQKKRLRWLRFFRLSEIDRFEDKHIPFDIRDMIEAAKPRRRRRR